LAARFDIEKLSAKHDRSRFDCGSEPLNRYFTQQVTQDIRRRVAACFVAVTSAGAVAGYYTLASASVPLADLPPDIARKLPRYPSLPAVRMGRLAIDRQFKGQGLGAVLLADALTRALSSDIAAFALIVDAKDDAAAAFYRHHGFLAFDDNPRALFLPLATVKALPRA
jgi:ribosomal protein S18 acetylase RimI-like enzyme